MLSELLGVPAADRTWIEVAAVDYDNGKDRERVIRDLAVYFTDLIAAKRAEPRDDLVSAFVRVRDESDPADAALTDTERLSGVSQLVMAAFDMAIGGVAIPAGEWALLATSSANGDPDRFPGPERLDFGREPGGCPSSLMHGLEALPVRLT